ncbi:hypothetical protein QQ045_032676 [Rhodiola kirilowii]
MVSKGSMESDSSSNRKKRGPTCMKNFIEQHKDGTKVQVTIEADGTIGGEVRTSFRTYIGTVAKSRIPITYKNWKLVPKELRETVWEETLRSFDVPQNEMTSELNKTEMRAVGVMWRNFKSKLSTQYIFGDKQGQDPREKYSYIQSDQWTRFVEQRSNLDALQIREVNIDRAKLNKFQHTLSRSGYKKAREDLVAVKKAEMEAEGLISLGDDPVIEVKRHGVWLRGHIRRNKEYVNESMREVADKIDQLKEQASQRLFTSHGRRDILTEATGKDEYPGCTRGVGSFVGWMKVFGKQSSSSSTRSTVTSNAPMLKSHHSGTDPGPFVDIPEVGKKCVLHVEGGLDQHMMIVALGKVMTGRIVQYQELDDDMVKVLVNEAIEPSAEQPNSQQIDLVKKIVLLLYT